MKRYKFLRLAGEYRHYKESWKSRDKISQAEASQEKSAQDETSLNETSQPNRTEKKEEPNLKTYAKLAAEFAFYNHVEVQLDTVWKNVKETIKPYKGSTNFIIDLFVFPFFGIGNIIGAGIYFMSLAFFPFKLLTLPFRKNKAKYLTDTAIEFSASLSDAILRTVRGATQIAATPLVWLRIPIRLAITWFKGAPRIEEGKGFRELADKKPDENFPGRDRVYIAAALLQKFNRSVAKGEKTGILKEDVKNFGDPVVLTIDQNKFDAIQTFFRGKIKERDQAKESEKIAKKRRVTNF